MSRTQSAMVELGTVAPAFELVDVVSGRALSRVKNLYRQCLLKVAVKRWIVIDGFSIAQLLSSAHVFLTGQRISREVCGRQQPRLSCRPQLCAQGAGSAPGALAGLRA